LLYAAIVDRTEMRIYRDEDGDGFYTAIDHLVIPPSSNHRFLSSVEPVVDQVGAFGRTYFGIVASPNVEQIGITNSSIWLFRLTLPGEEAFTRRVDEGAAMVSITGRIEPELRAGTNELYLYYSHASDQAFHRCRTGIGGPAITAHPASARVCPGGSVSISVSASGGATAITYQWQRQLAPALPWIDLADGPVSTPDGDSCGVVSGSASATVRIDAVRSCAGGVLNPSKLRCISTNEFGSVPSWSATLTICSADFNCDGMLDPDDLADYIGAFFSVPAGAGSDFNADGVTDPDDLADFIGAFFSGC